MDLYKDMILIKNVPRTLDIKSIETSIDYREGYNVIFYSNLKLYFYKKEYVKFLKRPECFNADNIKIYKNGRQLFNIKDVCLFKDINNGYIRVIFNNGDAKEYCNEEVKIERSIIDYNTNDIFSYFKQVAKINSLGKDEDHGGILHSIYEKIKFISEESSAAPFLNSKSFPVKNNNIPFLIFPFGCNGSQKKAVENAFENQISIIKGPPGTGKTQTILNIIANIIIQNKTVLVVSNNNSAIDNVKEKLQEEFGFILASLGNNENKERFINEQDEQPSLNNLYKWKFSRNDVENNKSAISYTLTILNEVYKKKEYLATLKVENKAIELEWNHFVKDYNIDPSIYHPKKGIKSSRYMKLWLQYQSFAENDILTPNDFLGKFREIIKWKWMNFVRSYVFGIKSPFNLYDLNSIILELQILYYIVCQEEIKNKIEKTEKELKKMDGKRLDNELKDKSLNVFKNYLFIKYNKQERLKFEKNDLWKRAEEFSQQYPVILSTTFSARTSLIDFTYDYIIMDEASQVSIETGFLALTCAKNAVIVGDPMQLPNVITEEDYEKQKYVFSQYRLKDGFNCSKYSFLQSICLIIPSIKIETLKEHYRCHPTIINFCNQRFYGGELIIMSEDNNDKNTVMCIKTVPGEHSRKYLLKENKESKFNQREIDEIKESILKDRFFQLSKDIGIITPYKGQVERILECIPSINVATIHKFQGRENDIIIMSTVDDYISEFSDDAHLINVAVSRAKKQFILITSGNTQSRKGNIAELIDYIDYHNPIKYGKVFSIFDYLYSGYTKKRIEFLRKHKKISDIDSENITYSLIEKIISEHKEFSHLGVLCHFPVRNIIPNTELLNNKEKEYVLNPNTHVDFLIINHITKKPVLAIETDGYFYHNKNTKQYNRDKIKDCVFSIYDISLLRLSTIGNNEEDKIIKCINDNL